MDRFNSYEDFKKSLDYDVKFRNLIKNDIKSELHKIKTIKGTLFWIFNRRGDN